MLSFGRQAGRQVRTCHKQCVAPFHRSRANQLHFLSPSIHTIQRSNWPLLQQKQARKDLTSSRKPSDRGFLQYYSTLTVKHTSSSYNDKKSSIPRWQIIVPLGAAGLALLYYNRQPLSLEDSQPLDPEGREARNLPQFAQSVEDVEEEEKRLHRNAFLRTFYKFGGILQDYIIEPLGTTKRFIVLVFLFVPVILTMPMILVGRFREGGRRRGRRISKDDGGTRWGARWWYGFLVKQMERAGPTFIKVSRLFLSSSTPLPSPPIDMGNLTFPFPPSACTMGWIPARSFSQRIV